MSNLIPNNQTNIFSGLFESSPFGLLTSTSILSRLHHEMVRLGSLTAVLSLVENCHLSKYFRWTCLNNSFLCFFFKSFRNYILVTKSRVKFWTVQILKLQICRFFSNLYTLSFTKQTLSLYLFVFRCFVLFPLVLCPWFVFFYLCT